MLERIALKFRKSQINAYQNKGLPNLDDSIMNLMHEPGESRGKTYWNRLKRIYHLYRAIGRSLQHALDDKEHETNNSKNKTKNTRDHLLQDVRRIHRRMKLIHTIFGPISLIYYSIIVPFRFAFHSYTTPWQVVDLILDFVYITLGAFYFYSRYSEKHKLAEYTLVRKVSSLFLDSFFYRTVFIFLVSAPWELYNGDLLLIKLLQVYNIRELINDGETATQSIVSGRFNLQLRILLPLRKALVNLIVVIHIAACFWILVGRESTISWLHTWDPSDSYSNTDIYIQAMMFMTETISTVGYGDTPPQAEVEYWLPMFMQFVSNYFYTLFFVLIREAVTKFDIVNHLIQIKKDEMISWLLMLKTGNNTNLYSMKFSEHLEDFIVKEKGVTIKGSIKSDPHFNSLPFDLQCKLIGVLLSNDLKKFEEFLRPLSLDFILGFIVEMNHFDLAVSEDLFVNGRCDGIYLLSGGLIEQMTRVGNRTKKLHIQGAVIGVDYLVLKKKPKDIYRNIGEAKGYYIPRDAFLELMKIYRKDFFYFKFEALKASVKNFFHLLDPPKSSRVDVLNVKDMSKTVLPAIPKEPEILTIRSNHENFDFSNSEPKLSREISRRYPINNLFAEDSTLEKSDNNSKNPIFLPASIKELGKGQKSEEELRECIPILMKEHSIRKEEIIRPWKEQKRNSTDSLDSIVSEDAVKEGQIEVKERPSNILVNLITNNLPGMIREQGDVEDENKPKTLEAKGEKRSTVKLTGTNTKVRKKSIEADNDIQKKSPSQPPISLQAQFSANLPPRNLVAKDEAPEDHDSNNFSAEIVFTELGDKDNYDTDPDWEHDTENQIDNSLEIPVEDVVDNINLLDAELFTLEEICGNLNGRYCKIINQYKNLAYQLRSSVSQSRKGMSYLRYKYN